MNATKPFQTQNFYELLEVPPAATEEEIRAAYQRSMELYGPDSVAMYALDDATQVAELRAKIDEAWKVLRDEESRTAYDSTLGIESRPVKRVVTLVPAAHEVTGAEEAPLAEPPPAVVAPPSPESKFEVLDSALVSPTEPKPQRPRVDIPPGADFNGELLRRVREGRGLSLRQISDRTRISVSHLENVEADRYGELPALVYLRGIVTSLSKELGLDPSKVAKSYLGLMLKAKK
jgi:hypothetical protein